MGIRGTAAAFVLAAIAATAQAGPAGPGASPPPRGGAADAVRAAFADWAAGGSGFFERILAPDVRWTIKGSGPAARTYVGRDAFLREAVAPFAARLAQPIRPTLHQLVSEGDTVVALWDGAAVAADGKPYRNSYAWVFRMRGGQAAEVTAFLDLDAYQDVLDRVPAPPAGR